MESVEVVHSPELLPPNNGFPGVETRENEKEKKPKVVVVMGATGSGKSRLAIDLASHFPVEIINADSMQVYKGLDVLTNKVPLHDQKGVPHHLFGTISPNVEFTSKDFRDSVIPIIEDVLSRNCLPVIVGGTNYYIQALVSPYLLDDLVEYMDDSCSIDPPGNGKPDHCYDLGDDSFSSSYDHLKELDPVAANRIHPNDHRKVNHYLNLYGRTGITPSKLYQGKSVEKWGRVGNFRYDCCFVCIDAALPVLDQYVEQRVDCMMDAGLLNEVYDIYNPVADYTRGLRQAIGVREFEDFLRLYPSKENTSCSDVKGENYDSSAGISSIQMSADMDYGISKENLQAVLDVSIDSWHKILFRDAIDRLKANTRRLVRRQKRRLNRLQTLFGWNIHYVDATDAISCKSDDSWAKKVVDPSVKIIRSFLHADTSTGPDSEIVNDSEKQKSVPRDLWTQYICEACGNRILRGEYEWEQHKQGRAHRKRISRLKKSQNSCWVKQQQLLNSSNLRKTV